MLKVFFPGGDPLVAPKSLCEIEQKHVIGKDLSNETSIKLLSRIFSLVSFESAKIDLSKKNP